MKTSMIALALALSTQVYAGAIITKEWKNPECDSGSCDLKAFRIYTQKDNNGQIAGTDLAAEIETATKSDLRKYALVQYIRGCVYESNSDGLVRFPVRDYFGKKGVVFKHPVFQIDSANDRDPIYWSNPDAGYDELRGFDIPRHSSYVSANPLQTESYKTWAGKDKNIPGPKLFISDTPTISMLGFANNRLVATNSSLKFRICVHEVSKVPSSVDDPSTIVPNPIACMDWNSNFIYDFKKKVFVDKLEDISPVCN